MKRRLQLIVALVAFAFLAGACSPIKEIGAWELKDMNAAVVFYTVKQGKTPDEAKLRDLGSKIANEWREKWSDVQVVIFYDESFARGMLSPNQKQTLVTPEGIKIDKSILTGSSLNPPGGAYLRLSDKKPQLEWAFIGKEVARNF